MMVVRSRVHVWVWLRVSACTAVLLLWRSCYVGNDTPETLITRN
jgi:hypothetical protein